MGTTRQMRKLRSREAKRLWVFGPKELGGPEPEVPVSQASVPTHRHQEAPRAPTGLSFLLLGWFWPCADGSGSGSPSLTQPPGFLCCFLSAFLYHEGGGRAPRLHPCPSSPHQLTEVGGGGFREAAKGIKDGGPSWAWLGRGGGWRRGHQAGRAVLPGDAPSAHPPHPASRLLPALPSVLEPNCVQGSWAGA